MDVHEPGMAHTSGTGDYPFFPDRQHMIVPVHFPVMMVVCRLQMTLRDIRNVKGICGEPVRTLT